MVYSEAMSINIASLGIKHTEKWTDKGKEALARGMIRVVPELTVLDSPEHLQSPISYLLNQKFWEWCQALCVLTSHPGDSDVWRF